MSTNNEQAKTEFIEACLKDHDKDTCEKMWNDAKAGTKDSKPVQISADYAELAKGYEMQKVEIDRLKTQLRQAIDIAQRANDKEKARGEAEKERLIMSIMQDSKYAKEALTVKSLDELCIIRTAIDHTIEKTFASVAAEIDEARKPKHDNLTVGEWDPEKKQWKGGR